MSTPTVERTGDWDAVSFAGGYAGLRDLAADEFSGTVTAGAARLFMLRGSVIGILDGDIDDFEDADGTARRAPHPALPLLAVMQERSDEVRAQYYTEETPISEVDRTLSDGNFTGFIELSENVLSGDYYQVYHQGHSMSVAYVGASERLITDDDAFEQADDEVGIYEVRPVDIEVTEIPEPAEPDTDDSTAVAADATGSERDEPAGEGLVSDLESDSAVDDDPSADSASSADTDGATERPSTDAATDPGDDTATDRGPDASDAGKDAAGAGGPDRGTASGAAERSGSDSPSGTGGSADETSASGGERAVGSDQRDASTDPQSSNEASGGTESARDASSEPRASPDASPTSDARSSTDAPAGDSPGNDDGDTARTNAAAGANAASDSRSSGGSTGGQRSASGGTRRGEPAPDHPAAASRSGAGGRDDPSAAPETSSNGAVGPSDLEVRSLPSLDPSRTASASRQERERTSTSPGGGSTASGGTAGGDRTARSEGPADGEAAERNAAPANSDSQSTGGGASRANDPQAGETAGTASESAPEPTQGRADDGGAADPSQSADDAGAGAESTSETANGADGAETDEGPSAADDAAGDLADAQAEVERLESELAELQEDHEDVVSERDRLESELAEAREEIERLRDRLEDATGQAGEASRKLSPREAIDETNLFIRYDSKGEATLQKAHAGDVDKAAVDDNMRVEYHTSFDADDAAVDGIGFDQFLTDTVQYRFVDWLVRKLLYEIRDTGNTGTMGDLYDALPKVDRAELNGQVGVQYSEDGQEHRAQIAFDVIVRDRMGNPLIVANLNDSRDPATEDMMTDLVRAAERVGESSQSLAGAFLVTRSFFEPGALETAEEATAGGLLNRGKQKSFVNLSRKGGYHLCLVEARNQEFHLAVPEL